MTKTIFRRVSVAAQIVEDLSYRALSPNRFQVELLGTSQRALHKWGGFFLFSNLKPGTYALRLSGEGFQTQQHPLTVPIAPFLADSPPAAPLIPLFAVPGDNELLVAVRSVNPAGRQVLFDPLVVPQPIYEGATVIAAGLSTTLREKMNAGRVTEAKLDSVAGLAVDSILRVVRAPSIRMRFDSYHQFPIAVTRVVGRVSLAKDPGVALAGAQIRLLRVNGVGISLNPVADADIAAVQISGQRMILGSAADVVTESNGNGDYNFYFPRSDFFQSLTLEASLAGYQIVLAATPIQPGQRRRIDFSMIEL